MPFSLEKFKSVPVIGILRGYPKEVVLQLAAIYFDSGLRTLEITMNSPNPTEVISAVAERYGDRLNVGAGTVCTERDLEAALGAGAEFIVSPIVNDAVIKTCVEQGIPVFPGAYTPTEIYRAWELGATAVKLFPMTTGGIRHLQAIKAPLNNIPLVPTGGVAANNFLDYLDLGVYGVGMGGQLFPKKFIQQERWSEVLGQMHEVKYTFDQWKKQRSV